MQYTEDISKTNNWGLSHLRIKRKVVRAYNNLTNVERCPVELYKKDTCLTCQMKSVTMHFIFARFAKAKWGNMVLQKDSRERNFRRCRKENYKKKRISMGTPLITLSGVLVLHNSVMVVFQNSLSKEPLVIGLPMVSENINVPHLYSKGEQAKFCRFLFQKRLSFM